MPKINEAERAILLGAVDVLRGLSRFHNDAFQRTRDSLSAIELHKGRMAMEKAIQLDRMANEINVVASTNGL